MNMERDVRAQSASLNRKLCEKKVVKEISSDFLIPDDKPEARRILVVSERLLPPAKYLGASAVECNGLIDYRVIYLGVDGGLWGVCFSSEYELEAPLDIRRTDTSGAVNTVISAVCEGSTARIGGGRRLGVKSRICADVWAYEELFDEGGVTRGDDESVEILISDVSCADITSATSDVIELSGELGSEIGEGRVVSADATSYVREVRKGEDSLMALGDVTVKLLWCRDGQAAEILVKKIPFEGVVELDRPVGNSSCVVDCSVTDLAVNLSESGSYVSVSVTLSAYSAENLQVSYASDAYSVERECCCEMTELILPVSGVMSVGNFSQSERRPLSETSIPEGARLIEIFPRIIFDGCEYDGKYGLTGNSTYFILWEKDGEYGVSDIEFPVRYEAEGRAVTDPVSACRGEVIFCRGRIDGELLCIDAEISARLFVNGCERAEPVQDLTFGDAFAKEKNRMVIYYPADDETPWQVAKKYHVRADSLASEKNYYIF